jgi:hypothetical protein
VADVLHEGPCLPGLSAGEWRSLRAGYLSGAGYTTLAEAERSMAARDAALDRAVRDHEEVVLWFEHDLFDQLNLVWLLDALAARRAAPGRITLIVIGSHPAVEPFHGLGQLSPDQLAALFPERVRFSDEGMALARRTWNGVCASTPHVVAWLAGEPGGELPFMPGAVSRLLEELPGTRDGLSRTEREGLWAIAAGAVTLGEAFVESARHEARVFLGDCCFYRAMRGLASGRAPLAAIQAEPGAPQRTHRVRITDAGVAVLGGDADHAALNGLDRWVGGIRLEGVSPRWRFDTASRAPVEAPARVD